MNRTISFQLTIDDYVAASNFFKRPRTIHSLALTHAGKPALMIIVVVFFMLIVFFLLSGRADRRWVELAGLLVFLLIAGAVFLRVNKETTRTYYNHFITHGGLGTMPKSVTVELLPDGVRTTTDDAVVFLNATSLLLLEKTDSHFLYSTAANMAYMIPLRAFAATADADAFFADLQSLAARRTPPTRPLRIPSRT